jgi:hypothetical protein
MWGDKVRREERPMLGAVGSCARCNRNVHHCRARHTGMQVAIHHPPSTSTYTSLMERLRVWYKGAASGHDQTLHFALCHAQPFFVGGAGGAGGFLGSLVPIAAWLNPLLTTGYAVEVSNFFNIQPWGELPY